MSADLATAPDNVLAALHIALLTADDPRADLVEAEMARRDADEVEPELEPVDPREQALALLDVYREVGETRLGALRRQYREMAAAQYDRAETACNGHLLSRAALARGVSAGSLFTGSEARARACASGDLLHFWDEIETRLPTFAAYKVSVLGEPRARQAAAPPRRRKVEVVPEPAPVVPEPEPAAKPSPFARPFVTARRLLTCWGTAA